MDELNPVWPFQI